MSGNGMTIEMGDGGGAGNKNKRLIKIVGFVAMVAAIALVLALVIVFSGNEGSAAGDVQGPPTEGPTTPIYTTLPTTTTTVTPAPTTTPVPDATTPGGINTDTTDEPDTPPITTVAPPILPPEEDYIELEDILNGAYSSPSFGTWSTGNYVLIRNENGDLVNYDVYTNISTIILPGSLEVLQNSSRFTRLSSDESKVALAVNADGVYRHSFRAQYAVVDSFSASEVVFVAPTSTTRNTDAPFLQNFVWGPTGTSFAFVYNNDVYYQADVSSLPTQLTSTGQENVIFNGIPDWVYEEEVFSTYNALWFSKDGTKLAYASFDDTNVRTMWVPHYGEPGAVEGQYTLHSEIRYPKPGTTNPIVTVTLVDLQNNSPTTFSAPSDLNQPLLNQVHFVSNDTLAVVWTNRVQNSFMVQLCSSTSPTCNTIYSYTETNGWFEGNPLIFNEDADAFITILPQDVGGVLYKQIIEISDSNANSWTARGRTSTSQTILSILLWDTDNTIWYRATSETDSAEQHIYTVNAAGVSTCFTCGIVTDDGEECLHNSASINSDGDLISVTCSGPGVPQIFIYNTDGTRVSTWDDNQGTSSALASKIKPRIILETVPLGNGLPDAQVLLQVPDNVESRTNVPLLVYVYGGPNTARVTRQWQLDWGSSLVSRWGIAVAQIDGRGSSLRGVENMFTVNRRLGTVEIEDQILATRALQNSLSWVDANRTCIWGWSYGGYAASLALANGADVFRCAIAIAPVTDWKFYDTIYTERYMDTPQNNPAGYSAGSLLNDDVVEVYRNKSYFLIHGTEDDNVHYQHAMALSRLLQRNDVAFEQMTYVDENHSLPGVTSHLYQAMEKFLEENLF